METSRAEKNHSRFGIASICIGCINILVIVYVVYRIASWIVGNPEIIQNPRMIERMQISDSAYRSLLFIFFLQISAMLIGVIGLFERDRKKATAFAGVSLNGLIAFFTAVKMDLF